MGRFPGAPRAGAVLLAAAALGVSFVARAGGFPHRVLHRIAPGGAAPVQALAFGPGGRHIYAAAGEQLRSYDAASGEPGPTIRLPGVGVAAAVAARDAGTLYVVTRAPARLVIMGLRPLRITSSIALRGGEPSALLYDSGTDALFVESRTAGSVARLDPSSGKRLAVAHLRGRLQQMAANGRGTLYVANAAANELEVVEAARMTRTGAIPLTGCTEPTGLAMDQVGRRLFVGCGNGEALVVDEDMGFTFVRLPIQPGGRLRVAFAMHPFGPAGWKGGAFMAGATALSAVRMKAFISYVGGGNLPLAGRCTALAVSPAARRLVLALAPSAAGTDSAGAAAGGELWVIGAPNEGVRQ